MMASSTTTLTVSWETLLTLDRKSVDFTHSARRLLNDQRHGKSEFPRFDEEEASKLIELIEPTILQHPEIAGDLKSTAFTVLRRLCGTFGKLPKSCSIDEDFKTQEEIPFATRGYTDLWERNWNERKVAVKTLRFGPDDDRSKTTKRFCKEAVLWKRLNHPNILPFHGASMLKNQFCMVSPWMENGNVLGYTRKNPEDNRLRLLTDAASGLKFLHRMSVVHGNIRGSNILISDNHPPQALLGDFGLNTVIFDPSSLTRASINWTAPELLTPDSVPYQPSIPSDIYAFGMVVYEVLMGTPPFAGRKKREVTCKVVLEGERPQRPRDSEKLGFTDRVWEVLQGCWEKEPSARPSIDNVAACLKHAAETWAVDVPAFMLASEAGVEKVMNMREEQAKDFANKLDGTLDQIGISQESGRVYLNFLQKLCSASGVFPASFMLTDGFDEIEAEPFASGGFAELYRATYKGQPVVAKALKTTSVNDLENMHRRFAKEVVGWRWLRHENILPFVGVSSSPSSLSMVSVWMENGDIMNFTKDTPNQNPFSLLTDAANGLQYLHQHNIVHGDIKGANILINSQCRACLADFGFTVIAETSSVGVEGYSDHEGGGTIRWMAPEILDPKRYGYVERARRKLPSKKTDIYALGMTILEVITGQNPFENTSKDDVVVKKVLSGVRPDRPTAGFSDALWMPLTQTWLEEYESTNLPPARPNIAGILEQLQCEEKAWSPTSGILALPVQIERKPSAASSDESSRFLGQFAEGQHTDDSKAVSLHVHEVDFESILKNVGCVNDLEPTDDDWDFLDPEPPTVSSWAKKSSVKKAWSKSKELFIKKLGRRKASPKLSDKLVPERDEGVRWYEALFSKPPKPAATRKPPQFTEDT